MVIIVLLSYSPGPLLRSRLYSVCYARIIFDAYKKNHAAGAALDAAGLSDRTLVANADGTGFRRVPFAAFPIEIGGVVADGGESVGDCTVDIGSRVSALMMAGESKPFTGNVGSLDAISGGLSFFSGLAETGMTPA